MNFKIKQQCDSTYEDEIQLFSIDDLLKFVRSQEYPVIVTEDRELIIYDEHML